MIKIKILKPILFTLVLLTITVVLYNFYLDYSQKKIEISKDKIEYYDSFIKKETKWLVTHSASNGALTFRPKSNGVATVNPYFSNILANILVLSDRNNNNKDIVNKYLYWYLKHLNTKDEDLFNLDGTIYDYKLVIDNGIVSEESSKNSYDSTDSYSSTFLTLLWNYSNEYNDYSFVLENYENIDRVIDSLLFTIKDGLSYAKPDFRIKYLMDNSEVYEGLFSSTLLIENLIEKDVTNKLDHGTLIDRKNFLSNLTLILINSINSELWDNENENYHAYVDNKNKTDLDFRWSNFYPDATSQLFPIIHKVLDSKDKRAIALYDEFNLNYKWEEFEHIQKNNDDFYWGQLPFTAAIMNDEERLIIYLKNYENEVALNHEDNIYGADSAWVVLACQTMIDKHSAVIEFYEKFYILKSSKD